MSYRDPSSFARPDFEISRHLDLKLNVNFEKKVIEGSVTHTIDIIKSDGKVVFDVSDVIVKTVQYKNSCVDFDISDFREGFGSKLTVTIPENTTGQILLTIFFETSPSATGLQWLSPEQTHGKKHPYMFSQFQAIHCRSVVPCQDSPGIKTTYSASVTHPAELTCLMSALRTVKGPGETTFAQNVPTSSYLIAIAVGDLATKNIGPNSAVWTEAGLLEESAYEFAETSRVLKIAEEICGPYVWGQYDLLILPPSFPYGGMENPCLTFVTPTLIAGDRSLVDVVAHEISHSWTGNLVTNNTFEHFWLNEGFTVFVEHKIVGRMYGDEKYRDFASIQGLTTLKEEVNLLGETNPFTCLVVNLESANPDDAFSSIPYMKGSLFLRYLEQLVGGPNAFEPFLKQYLDHFKYKSITTVDFQNYFTDFFKNCCAIQKVDWETWLHKPGMPPVIPSYNTELLDACNELVSKWLNWDETKDCTPQFSESSIVLVPSQMIEFLSRLVEKAPFSIKKLQNIDHVHKLAESKNSEIKFRWLRICIKSHWEEKIPEALEFITDVGRMKYVRPLYRDLYDWELSRERAITRFQANRKNMMHVAAYTVAKDLKL